MIQNGGKKNLPQSGSISMQPVARKSNIVLPPGRASVATAPPPMGTGAAQLASGPQQTTSNHLHSFPRLHQNGMLAQKLSHMGPPPAILTQHQHQQNHHHLSINPASPISGMNFELTWLKTGCIAMNMEEWERASVAFESVIKHSPMNLTAYYLLAASLHQQQQFVQAIEVYHRLLGLLQSTYGNNPDFTMLKGEIWSSIGHCALLLDDLPRSFSAFQQSLQLMGSPKDPSIWFAIGLLYDRYGAEELAREAFLITLRFEQNSRKPDAPPTNREREIYYRLGLIYKSLKKWNLAHECLGYSLHHPPIGLGSDDVRILIGVFYGLQGMIEEAKAQFEVVGGKYIDGKFVEPNRKITASKRSKLKNRIILGWYEARAGTPEAYTRAFEIITKVTEEDPSESFAWYTMGRIHMLRRDYAQAYDAYQQAVYRDGTNAAFWNSIGILYYEIGQFRDSLDAFSRSIHLAPFVADTWWNLGVLYETSHKQYEDALDAYNRAAELDSSCGRVLERIEMLKNGSLGEVQVINMDGLPPRPVEYCPMPFFSRPVLLGDAKIPPQRPSLQQLAEHQLQYQQQAAPPQPQMKPTLQQSRMAQPQTFAGQQNGTGTGFSLPTPNQIHRQPPPVPPYNSSNNEDLPFKMVRKARSSTSRRSLGREERPAPFTPNQTGDNEFSTVNLSGSQQAQGSVPRPPIPLAQQSAYNDEDTMPPIESPVPQKPAETGGGGFFGWFQKKPEAATEAEKPSEIPATEKPKLPLSYKSALTTDMPASGGTGGGIQGTGGGQADLDSIGHAMKSENARKAEAEAKYGRLGSGGMPTTSYAYPASPLPPRVDLYNNNTAAGGDLEAGKQVSAEKSNKKKKIIIITLVILLLVGAITGVVLAMILPKGKKSAKIKKSK